MLAVHAANAALSGTSEAAFKSNLGYSGEQWDASLRMQNLRARVYDPRNGRFIGLDPFAGNMQDPQSLHKYAYTHGDPIQGIDPTGRSALFWLYSAAKSIATGTPLLQVSAGTVNRIKNIRAETGASGSIDPSRSDKLATGSFQFFFAIGEPVAALQRVTNKGTLEVRLTSGREIKMTYDEQYLEAFANPGKAIADINRITDNHQQRPPGRALEKLLGGNFYTTPGNIYDLFYKDRNGNIELVEFWKWKAEVDFELVFAPAPSMKFGEMAHRSIRGAIVIDDSVFGQTTHNQHISSISHIGGNNPNLRFPNGGKILEAKDRYESSNYGTSDTSVTITKVHGNYQ